jgi:hypothetical protein
MAPVTVRKGDIVLHVNDLEALPKVLAALQQPHETTGNPAEAIRATAAKIQHGVSSQLDCHCSSLRDVVYKLRKGKLVSSQLLKRIQHLNDADSEVRHSTKSSLEALAREVLSAVAASVETADVVQEASQVHLETKASSNSEPPALKDSEATASEPEFEAASGKAMPFSAARGDAGFGTFLAKGSSVETQTNEGGVPPPLATSVTQAARAELAPCTTEAQTELSFQEQMYVGVTATPHDMVIVGLQQLDAQSVRLAESCEANVRDILDVVPSGDVLAEWEVYADFSIVPVDEVMVARDCAKARSLVAGLQGFAARLERQARASRIAPAAEAVPSDTSDSEEELQERAAQFLRTLPADQARHLAELPAAALVSIAQEHAGQYSEEEEVFSFS